MSSRFRFYLEDLHVRSCFQYYCIPDLYLLRFLVPLQSAFHHHHLPLSNEEETDVHSGSGQNIASEGLLGDSEFLFTLCSFILPTAKAL